MRSSENFCFADFESLADCNTDEAHATAPFGFFAEVRDATAEACEIEAADYAIESSFRVPIDSVSNT